MNGQPPEKNIKKFLFDTHDFNDDADEDLDIPEEPSFSEAELEAAKQAAYNKGRQEAERAALESREKQISEYISVITRDVTDLYAQEEQRIATYEAEAVALTDQIFKRLFPYLNKAHGLNEVMDVIKSVLSRHHANPKINIYVPQDYFDDIDAIFKDSLDSNLAEKIELKADQNLGLGDCRIQWYNGGAERSATSLSEKIEEHLKQMLADQNDMTHNNSSDVAEVADNNDTSASATATDKTDQSESDAPDSKNASDINTKDQKPG